MTTAELNITPSQEYRLEMIIPSVVRSFRMDTTIRPPHESHYTLTSLEVTKDNGEYSKGEIEVYMVCDEIDTFMGFHAAYFIRIGKRGQVRYYTNGFWHNAYAKGYFWIEKMD